MGGGFAKLGEPQSGRFLIVERSWGEDRSRDVSSRTAAPIGISLGPRAARTPAPQPFSKSPVAQKSHVSTAISILPGMLPKVSGRAVHDRPAKGVPTIGEFRNGVGEFYDQEPFHGRAILVRYVWSRITPISAHFEQSFSEDGGKTWEVNWVTDQNRVRDESPAAR
jgi:hypothetical protein